MNKKFGEPIYVHASVWYNNWTQLEALQYIMDVDHAITRNIEEVNQLRLDGRWNDNVMTELFDRDICDHVYYAMDSIQNLEERDTH